MMILLVFMDKVIKTVQDFLDPYRNPWIVQIDDPTSVYGHDH